MKLTKLAVLLSGAALSASALAASDTHYQLEKDPFFGGSKPQFNVDETKPASQSPVRFGDENDTSWLTPQAKPQFAGNQSAASADHLGLPNDLDENALASGTATYGQAKRIFTRFANARAAE